MTGLDMRVDLLALDRISSRAAVARFRLTNYDTDPLTIADEFTEEGGASNNAISGPTLVDMGNRKRYFVLRNVDGRCICSDFGIDLPTIRPRQSITVYTYFPAPPKRVNRVTVLFPYTNPFFAVPLGTRKQPVPIASGQAQRRPSKAKLAPPKIVSLISISESLSGASETREGNQQTRVRLSADVLFPVNESRLTSEARSELKDVAHRIQRSKPDVVHIDGYTDNTGTPAINDPLSKARARSVKEALTRLIPRPTLTFKAQGHGADNPIADNSTKSGRQKNRRVTITFKR